MAPEKLTPKSPLITDQTPPPAPGAAPPKRHGWLIFPRPIAWAVLTIALLASAVGWLVSRKNAELRARTRFDEQAGLITAALERRMGVYEDVLHGAVGLFAASSTVERGEWRTYMDSVSIERRFPGIAGVGYVERVARQDLEGFLVKTRADNAPDFRVRSGGDADDLLIIKFIEPAEVLGSLLGRDIGVNLERRAVAERACATGKAALSSALTLQEESASPDKGFLMLLPVYRQGLPVATAAERGAALQGWVFARFLTDQLMWAVLGEEPPQLHLRIVDSAPLSHELAEDMNPQEDVVFDQYPMLTERAREESPLFSSTMVCEFGGRTWTLSFAPTPSYKADRYGASVWVGAGGVIISLLLFAIAWSLSHTRERALGMAAAMTRTLRETNRQLESEISERQKSEHALIRSEAMYHSLVESLPLSIARKDAQGRVLFANPRFCSDLDKPLEDLVGKTDADLFAPELAASRALSDRRVLETGEALENVEEWPGPAEGSRRFVQAIRTPVRDEAKQIVGLLGIFWDVTDKHTAQAELEHERFLLRTLMDNVPDRIYFKDRQSRFVRNNRAHLRTFGLRSPEEATGKSDFDFFSEEHARQAYEDEQRLMAGGKPATKEERETWPDGSVTWVLSTKMPLRDESGHTVGTFGISRDITDRKRAEEAMRLAKEAAEEANATKSRFLANMSHELRTPLNSVIGFANILLKNKAGNLTPAELNFLDRILANGKHLLTLINEILDLSKIEARKTELQVSSVSIDSLIRETLSQQESLVRDRPIQLLAEIPAQVAPFLTDADKLRQVLINLLANALKFTEHGTVTVRLSTDPATQRPLRMDVIDTGIGIPRDKLQVIFEAFQQAEAGTARKYGGTGLGLTISQALCRLMGYRIEVTSKPGSGSTFSVHLAPAAAAQAPLAAHPADQPHHPMLPSSPGAAALKRKLVLVIDDDLDSRTLLAHAIEEFGCQTLVANSGEQGLRMAREFQPHLITVDLMMPDLDGWQVIQALKADRTLCRIPIVVVSIVAAENRARILGAVEVLQKPVIRAELLAVLQRCLPDTTWRVLIIDDDADSRRLVATLLEDEGCEYRLAANGREALAVLDNFTPDLVFLDLIMPIMDGMAFLNQLRSTPRFRLLPVVIVTAKELTPAEARRLGNMAEEVVQKGDNLQAELDRVLRAFLQPEGPHPDRTAPRHDVH